MTSLAQQLKRLALPQTDPSLLNRKEAASLLFEPKEAANIDRDTFFALGCTGYEELLGIDSSFESFEETLFSHASKSLQRSVLTKAVNEQLDDTIGRFLIHLSPYFMLKPAQKCLEWLIHRFHIHLYNQDNLIGCILPYHETKVFVRVVQILKISDPTHRWHWLHAIQKPGVPLARGTVITHCYKDMNFMEFICNLVTRSVQEFSEFPGSLAQLRVLISFYVSTIVAALDAVEKISDVFIAKLLPYIQKGLKTSLLDYKAATYMIICQLAVKTVMVPTLVKSLSSQITRTLHKTPSLIREGLGCLIVLLQNQQPKDIGKKPFVSLCKVPNLVTVLQEVASLYDISSLLNYLLPNLAHAVIHLAEESADVLYNEYRNQLELILCNIQLEKNLNKLLACTFLEEFMCYGQRHQVEPHKISELSQTLLPLIRLFESKYPDTLDAVLEEHLKVAGDEGTQNLFHQFISLSTSGGKHELLADCDTSLLLSLNHPNPAVRHTALQHLKHIIETSKAGFDEAFIQEAILSRLADDNVEVVLSALSAFKIYRTHFSAEVTVSHLLALFNRVDLSQAAGWHKALEEVVSLIQETSIKDNRELCTRLTMAIIPYMILLNSNPESAEQKMSVYLAKRDICNLHPLMKNWPKALDEILKDSKALKLIGLANSRMVQLISNNLSSVDASSSIKLVEDLRQVIDKEPVSVRQKVATLMLTQALVQGCSNLQDQELHAQVKVFQLLERRLRKMDIPAKETPEKCNLDIIDHIQLLSKYIEKLNNGQMAENEESICLLLLLKDFIRNLTCPKSFPKGNMWCNPETMDKASQNYFKILIRLFDLIIWGASERECAHFKPLMGYLFKEHLKSNEDLFAFLSVLWTYSCNLSNPLGCTVNAMLQTRSLYIGHALLASLSSIKKKQLASVSSPVTVCLLINLASPIREIRRAAINCLQTLGSIRDSPLLPVIQTLVQKSEEIVADSTYVVQTLGVVFEELQTLRSHRGSHKLLNALEQMLGLLQTPSCPSYIGKALMKALHSVHGEAVLSLTLPVMKRLLDKVTSAPSEMLEDEALLLNHLLGKFSEPSASLLAQNPQSLDLFLRALQTNQTVFLGIPSVQIAAIGQITKGFFAALEDGNVQQKILAVLFDLLLDSKNSACSQAISSAFKAISVNALQISAELEPPGKDKNVSTVRQTRRQTMQQQQQRKSQAPESLLEEGSVNWPRTTLILELLQHKKKLNEPQILVPTLFYLLSRCLESSNPEASLEYTKQLILSCLLNICQRISLVDEKDPKDVLEEEKFNVELIVQCVRTSDMPQTHHHALLLLGAAAGIFPGKVLHNIMPIFTFMGASVMRLDDNYSFQVISKTVQTVIPALIHAGENVSKETKEDLEQVVGNIIHVFVDALPHVPEHRRLPILLELLETVGPQSFLWVLLVLLFQQHVTKTVTMAANGEKDAVLEKDTEFWVSVCCQFSIPDQLKSLIKLLQFLAKLPENKEDQELKKSRTHKQKSQEAGMHLFNVETHSAKQLRHFKFLSVSFVAQLLASHSFVGKPQGDQCYQRDSRFAIGTCSVRLS
ncbi:hypothetical protein GDO86_009331 [Hymenochirus boettgeri]|uniref:HEAT repeat-containing protein 1 n=1 Tax=Hymenochirus boettgeri TaxID=247094 RepID=A0A8T2JNB4_9PIPI|nr:hypothetical protein GDO86_009331 [Hymenochirus boettgeri]